MSTFKLNNHPRPVYSIFTVTGNNVTFFAERKHQIQRFYLENTDLIKVLKIYALKGFPPPPQQHLYKKNEVLWLYCSLHQNSLPQASCRRESAKMALLHKRYGWILHTSKPQFSSIINFSSDEPIFISMNRK